MGRSLATLFLVFSGAAAPSAEEPPPRPFLRKVIGLTDAQLAAIEKGVAMNWRPPWRAWKGSRG